MDNHELDFSFDMRGLDRSNLLSQSAEQLDWLAGHLGKGLPEDQGDSTKKLVNESQEGALLRALRDGDIAELPKAISSFYKITDKNFLERNRSVPVRFEELAQNYSFYWLYLPIVLFPAQDWAFNRLEVAIEFNPDDPDGHTRPTAYQILPQKQFQTLLELSERLEVKLDENFEFSAHIVTPTLQTNSVERPISTGIDVKVAAGMGLSVGPFIYPIKRAKIDHTACGIEKVFWRLDGAEFFQGDDVPLVVVVQVPNKTKKIRLKAAMQAYRYFKLASADLQNAVKELPKVLREFFTGGIPICDKKEWDLTPKL